MNKIVRPIIYIAAAALVCVIVLFVALSALGYALITDDEGMRFIGRAVDGQAVKGTINYPSGETGVLDYEAGTIVFSNGDKYIGEIKGLCRHGYGTMQYAATGDVYVGYFSNDKISGTGVFTYAGGDVYQGTFKDNKYEGTGVMTYADGSTYEGSFISGVKSGYGVYTWAAKSDGTYAKYEGYFADDVKSGQGTLHYANGDIYRGFFSNDMRHGEGSYVWSDGERYDGNFVSGLIDTRTLDADGNFVTNADGTYVHGAKGKYTFASGKSYTGYFEGGKVMGIEAEIKETD